LLPYIQNTKRDVSSTLFDIHLFEIDNAAYPDVPLAVAGHRLVLILFHKSSVTCSLKARARRPLILITVHMLASPKLFMLWVTKHNSLLEEAKEAYGINTLLWLMFSP
jgi:hypothetical protein